MRVTASRGPPTGKRSCSPRTFAYALEQEMRMRFRVLGKAPSEVKSKTRMTDAERLKATDAVWMLATAKFGLAAIAQVKQAMH
jgi:hypothetical protein